MRYVDYIGSSKWRRNPARVAEMSAAGDRCRLCFAAGTAGSPLEAHHATYERFGAEIVGDLIALCRECHVAVTDFLRRRRYAVRSALRLDVRSMRDARTTLFDPTAREDLP